MQSSYTQHFPSGGDIHHGLTDTIANALKNQLSDRNSAIFRRLHNQSFKTQELIQLCIQDAFREIWESGTKMSLEFGFLGDPGSLERERYQVDKELNDLARGVFELIQPAISMESGEFKVSLNNNSVDAIISRLEREQKGTKNAAYLLAGQTNETEKIALERLLSLLKQAPARLKGELRKAGYPARVKYDQFTEGKVFKALEIGILGSAFCFMTYGWHGLTYNGLDSLARNARNSGTQGGVAENIISNQLLQGGITWGTGLLAATLIGYGLIRGARTHREYLIKDAEATAKEGSPQKVGTWLQRNGIFSASIALALSGALAEGTGILAHEVQGIYTAQKAYEVGKSIDGILDINSPQSPAGKAYAVYANAPDKIRDQAKKWYDAELSRPGASGVGPAAKAKQYLMDGTPIVTDPTLARDPSIAGIVSTTDMRLAELSPKSHGVNNTFALKAEGVQKAYTTSTDGLRNLGYGKVTYVEKDGKNIQTGGLYQSVYKLGTRAKTPDFLRAKDQFEQAFDEYERNQKAMNEKWGQITAVYQNYINQTSAAADAKYRSNTSFNASIAFETPDLKELRKKVAEVPKLEGKSPLEYWTELNNMTGKEGGITEAERAGIITLIALRSGVIEGLAALMLFLGLRKVKRYYNRPNNLLSQKEKTLVHGHYESIVESILRSFSGPNWKGIFPEHDGISRDEAEYLARTLIVSVDPTLIEWLPIRREGAAEGTQHIKKIGKNLTGVVKNIITGNTQTNHESYLAKLNTVMERLGEESKKDKKIGAGVGISMDRLSDILNQVLPAVPDRRGMSSPIENRFDSIVSAIAANLDTLATLSAQTTEHHADEREGTLSSQISELEEWLDGDMAERETQIGNTLRDPHSTDGDKEYYSEILKRMNQLRDEITQNMDPNFQDIAKWNREKNSITELYKKRI